MSISEKTLRMVRAFVTSVVGSADERMELLDRLEGRPKQQGRRDKMLNVREAAALAGVHYKTIWAWAGKGRIHARKITERRIRFSRNELAEFLGEEL